MLWDKIREQADGIPAVTFDLQPARPSSCGSVEWSTAPIIVLDLKDASGKTVAARDVLATLLHLAGHAAAADGSAASEDRYHSAQFADVARQLGLAVSTERVPGIGYRPEGLARGTLKRYDTGLRQLDRALSAWTPEIIRPRARGSVTYACQCEPPRRLLISPGIAGRGLVLCGICKQEFRPVAAS